MTAMNTALGALRQMIASGELGPGQKFPPEPELCERLGVSRSSLREAVRTLSALGVVESRHGSGVYVSGLDPSSIVQSFSLTIDLIPLDGLLELLEMRRVLEAYVAAQAAARATPELEARLSELIERMEAEPDPTRAGLLDKEFHDAFYEAAGNPTIGAFLRLFRARSSDYDIFSGAHGPAARAMSDRGHRDILAAIRARDPISAQAAAAAHVAQTEHWLRLQDETAAAEG